MKVLKFGGTSVGSPQRIKEVADLITDNESKIVALSAMSCTTNALVEISDYLRKRNPEAANNIINALRTKYLGHVRELYSTEEMADRTRDFLEDEFMYLHSFANRNFVDSDEKVILAQGEIMSTNMMTNYLREQGVKVCLISALDFMRTNLDGEPDLNYIREHLQETLSTHPGYDLYITQGFICRNHMGAVDNL